MYAKLENNQLVYAPRNYDTGTNLIINFNNNEQLMVQYGFKPVIDNKQNYDNTICYLEIDEYIEDEHAITINYVVKKIETNEEPTLEARIAELEKINKEQSELINTTMLATDEVVMLLEPLLIDTFTNEQGSSRIINMYVNIVQRGLKDAGEVPMRYREQVKKILDCEQDIMR